MTRLPSSRVRRVLRTLLALVLALGAGAFLFALGLTVVSLGLPLPDALRGEAFPSLQIHDRHGKLLREVRTRGGALSSSVRLSELPGGVVPALLAAEDARFFSHPGVDPLAVLRAAAQMILERRVVSGASTITQQLARTVVPRPRTLRGKLSEMALALRIERSLSKERILEQYLSRVAFGPSVTGIDAASRFFFDKPAAALSLSEAATLVAIPRGPALYDPRRGTERVTRRRNRILERMRTGSLAPAEDLDLALASPVLLQRRHVEGGVLHFAQALLQGKLEPALRARDLRSVETTLDAGLQREVETLTARAAEDLSEAGGSALSVLVVENATGDVLAYVGSPAYGAADELGANDGVLALRQPGSALKPFLYAAAMADLGMTAASVLPDVPLTLVGAEGAYSPGNYDGRSHGPVRLRVALAGSLNVPAVAVAEQLGPSRLLELLHRVGFESLDRPPAHYGAALALGDGEVRLSELAVAYSTLARRGVRLPLRFARSARDARGDEVSVAMGSPKTALRADVAAAITDILADAGARAASFGRGSVLELPFAAAVKTGTSKGYRDNWTAGFTREITVVVWAGNFDGSPMIGSTGVTGAAPLFHDVMVAAMRGRTPEPLVDANASVEVEVCALSGARPGPACPHRIRDRFPRGHVPAGECSFHETVRIDPRSDLLAGPGCADAVLRTFERYPPKYAAWARAARRPVAPDRSSPRCPAPIAKATPLAGAVIEFPHEGARFALEPGEPAEIVLSARPPGGASSLRFVMDGKLLAEIAAPFELPWRLVPGTHRVEVEALGVRVASRDFEVAP